MFGGTFNKKVCPIGVDIGSRSVKLLQLERTATGFKAVAAASADLPDDLELTADGYHRAVAEALAHAKDAGKFVGNAVVSALPAGAVQYKNIRLPKMPGKDLAAAVQWEAQERLQLAGQPHATQFFEAGEVRQGEEERQEIIMLAAPTGFVESHVKALTDCGFAPAAIDVVPGALARCFEASAGDDATVTIDVGYHATKVLITRQGRILFFKLIDIGGRAFDEAASRKLNMPRTELAPLRMQMRREDAGVQEHVRRAVLEAVQPAVAELGREIGLCLRYYSVTFRGRWPESAALIGGEAGQDWLESQLTEQAGVTVAIANPLADIDLSGVNVEIGPDTAGAWATAAGLSMRPKQANAGAKGVAA